MRKSNVVILIIAIIVFFATFLFNFSGNPPVKEEQGHHDNHKGPSSFKVPHKGLHTYMGASQSEIEKHFGKPERIDPTPYGYDWWIYGRHAEQYVQIGIENGKVVTIYALGKNLPTKPFGIGEDASKIMQKVPLKDSLSLKYKGSKVELEFKEDELMVRPLLKFGDVWVQLNFDHFTNRLMSVRYVSNEILIKQRLYTITFWGKIDKAPAPTEKEWEAIDHAEAKEIFDICNLLRMRHGLDPFQWNDKAAQAAYLHSEEMDKKDYFAHVSQDQGDPGERLNRQGVSFTVAGENIAEDYTDGIGAVVGWLNSGDHRENLFNKKFTELGVGVYHKEYTQDFVKPVMIK